MGITIILRLLALLLVPGDDVIRYQWEEKIQSSVFFLMYVFWDERLFGLPWHAELWMRALIIAPALAALIMLAAQRKASAAAT